MPYKKKKLPKHVVIYNDILKMINDGMYPAESKLPTEVELSEQLNVSRMTLRKALQLLKEDDVIDIIQGSGNYVKKTVNTKEVGIEERGNLLKKLCLSPVDKVEYNLEITPPYEYTQTLFNRNAEVNIGIKGFHYDAANKLIAVSLSLMLDDLLSTYNIKLEKFSTIQSFLEDEIYTGEFRIRMEMKIVNESKMSEISKVKWNSKVIFSVVENVYDKIGQLVIHTKYYIPVENINILLNWYNI